jgi:hypothetical protein
VAYYGVETIQRHIATLLGNIKLHKTAQRDEGKHLRVQVQRSIDVRETGHKQDLHGLAEGEKLLGGLELILKKPLDLWQREHLADLHTNLTHLCVGGRICERMGVYMDVCACVGSEE